MNREKNKRCHKVTLILILLLTITAVCAVLVGQYTIGLTDFCRIITEKVRGTLGDSMKTSAHVIFQVRIPRILLAGMVGAGLSISGSALQGTFQNPLVSPDLLGVCSGAGFGAALGILIGNGTGLLTPVLSLVFGLVSVLLVFFFAGVSSRSETLSVILGGIIVSSIFTALISFIKYVADSSETLPAITFWQMGSFANASYHDIGISFVPIAFGIIGLLLLRWKINLLSLGDEDCSTLGINPNHTRWMVILFTTLTTAGCVTVSGVIGWVGLVIPHICRKIVGVNHGYLLPTSCLVGAIFMILVDTVARNLTSAEIPIGILTALIGAPFFAAIYHKRKKVG
ncbi:putative ABC transporter permease protein [Caprobacter fermentans]|uniref:Iron ABC transporter permease n=1 Tax=Caproicibacter fermentans TaxID=2576756 RepID=A0A6N8I2I8_9FIRM|nr:iron ABC transporter permease [Caproicibacter fermentans]MVB11753.1 putative ABC transporter permease protein [Caproicibacter fermentans]QNK39805.1 iron ABC transporter permease [Caproicibacter fermentans]